MQKRATIMGQKRLPFGRSACKVGPQLVSGNSDFRRNLDFKTAKGGLLCLMWSVLSPDVLQGVWNFGTGQVSVFVPPAPGKNLGHWASQVPACLLDNPSALLSQVIVEETEYVLGGSTGRGSWELVPGFPHTSPHATFPFGNFALDLFAVISHEHDYSLNPTSSPRLTNETGGSPGDTWHAWYPGLAHLNWFVRSWDSGIVHPWFLAGASD